MLQREYQNELDLYKIDRRIANLICHMGFVLADSQTENGHKLTQKLVKKTNKHLIVVSYDIRKRLICPPDPYADHDEIIQRMKP